MKNTVKPILLTFLFLYWSDVFVFGQYRFQEMVYKSELPLIGELGLAEKKPKMKIYDDHMFILNEPSENEFEIKKLKLPGLELVDSLSFHFAKGGIYDFLWLDNRIWLASTSLFCVESGETREVKNLDGQDKFDRLNYVDQQSFLAYCLYPFHPLDGDGLLYLYVVDSKTSTVTKKKKIPFEGISMGNIIKNWVLTVGSDIWMCYPLTGNLFKLDRELNKTDSFQLDIEALNSKGNLDFVRFMDSQMETANHQILRLAEKHKGEDIAIRSSYYSKDGISKKIDTLRAQYAYVEKIMNWEDDKVILTLFRPEYKNKFRDVYFVDLKEKSIQRVIKKWRCGTPEKDSRIERPEDYFTVDLLFNNLYAPLFYGNHIYSSSRYPVDLFQPGTKKEIDDFYFKWKRGEKERYWFLNRYTMDEKTH